MSHREAHRMSRPIHFEIPADDSERAIRFYKKMFGQRFQKWDGPIPTGS
jgi:predicted enzyme related to lactoylglutathione lyase